MSPEVMSSRPTIIRNRVDFPQPDGPTRIMNSPSCTSTLTSLTAGNPSPYFLTMFFMSMAAMRSTLHCAGGESGDDLSLEQQDDDDDGHRDDDRGRRQLPVGRVERVWPDEERHLSRHRSGLRRRCQRDREHELVPGEEERQDRGGEDTGGRQRDDHLAGGRPRGGGQPPGAASGPITLRKACHEVAPSTWAACSISQGISRKNAESVQMARGSVKD